MHTFPRCALLTPCAPCVCVPQVALRRGVDDNVTAMVVRLFAQAEKLPSFAQLESTPSFVRMVGGFS